MGKKDKVLGYVIYDGPSNYDSKPIMAIAIMNSKNPKTADMIQLYIMRSDIEPHTALKTGDDFSVCGKCPLRPISFKANGLKKKCYVRVGFAVLTIYRTYHRGRYARPGVDFDAALVPALFEDLAFRIGTYGDPV